MIFSGSRNRAFTLVELLTVIGIIAVLIGLATPVIVSMVLGGHTQQAVLELTGKLEQSRSYASAHNTYVYIFMENDDDDLHVVALTSVEGRNVLGDSLGGSADLDSEPTHRGELRVLAAPSVIERVGIMDGGDIAQSDLARPRPGNLHALGDGYSLTYRERTYPRSVVVSPSGSIMSPTATGLHPPGTIEFALHDARANDRNHAAAIVQLNGWTGQSHVYRN